MPFSSFSEYGRMCGSGFALVESRLLLAFAGLWNNRTGVRKVEEG